ncbi:unnamed protein product [Bursaphelenchus xylophilus]|uniref:(pine wood nematode) hypothetical protein n=1 Tax=Bursaphelenchus xylophilus TaxID=6326 RepID=A0A1I7SRP5_BURXY|nr:unnamed protein product [Bursaphelenchus xylophilus]CAG9102032.1 unnamed protein product [Bursaphelenchus xylophilus]
MNHCEGQELEVDHRDSKRPRILAPAIPTKPLYAPKKPTSESKKARRSRIRRSAGGPLRLSQPEVRYGELGVQPGQLAAGLTDQAGPGRKRNPNASSDIAPSAPGIPGGPGVAVDNLVECPLTPAKPKKEPLSYSCRWRLIGSFGFITLSTL